MGQLAVSVESGNSDSDNENADIESEDVSEEEPPSKRKRRSGCDIVDMAKELTEASGSMNAETGTTQGSRRSKKRKKKKKKAWANNTSQISTSSHLKKTTTAVSQEILRLEEQLLQITNKLQSRVVDGRAESERSPSPPPVYDNLGIIINSRETRLRAKLKKQRQTIISELKRKNPNFKPPRGIKSTNHQRMICVPTKEHPGFNFIGQILGPQGRTLRRIEMEAGAKLQLRGKCYGNEGIVWNTKPKPTDDEVYVLVSADNRNSLDAAAAMVEKLLVPGGGDDEFQPSAPPGGNAGAPVKKPAKEIDDANLFVGMLPDSVDETKKLVELFSRFGPICQAGVIRDKITGLSRGYGFVKYTDRAYAAEAVAQMNGYQIEGKTLIVRTSRNDRPPAVPQKTNPDPMHWPRPPEPRLPDTVAPFPNPSHLPVHDNPFTGRYPASLAPSFQIPAARPLFSGDFVTSDELAHFPGYVKSLDPPTQLYRQPTAPSSSLSSSQFQTPQNFGGYPMPPARYFGMYGQPAAPSSSLSSSQFQIPQNFGGYPMPPARYFGMYGQPAAPSSSLSSSQFQIPRNFGGYPMPPARYFGM